MAYPKSLISSSSLALIAFLLIATTSFSNCQSLENIIPVPLNINIVGVLNCSSTPEAQPVTAVVSLVCPNNRTVLAFNATLNGTISATARLNVTNLNAALLTLLRCNLRARVSQGQCNITQPGQVLEAPVLIITPFLEILRGSVAVILALTFRIVQTILT